MSLLRSNSAISNNLAATSKGATLASIYQAKKLGNEDTKVEVLKQQFQSQIERRATTNSHEPSKILNRYVCFRNCDAYLHLLKANLFYNRL